MADSDALKALKYAEEQLGANSVFEAAQHMRDEVELFGNELVELRHKKRELDASLVDREMILASEERGKHPEMSATAMEAHMRRVKNNDDEHREIRDLINITLRKIDNGEHQKTLKELDVKIAVSRLQELGGYFVYLAAIKNQARNASDA